MFTQLQNTQKQDCNNSHRVQYKSQRDNSFIRPPYNGPALQYHHNGLQITTNFINAEFMSAKRKVCFFISQSGVTNTLISRTESNLTLPWLPWGNIKHIYISRHSWGTDNWNPSSCKTRTRLYYTINIMDVGNLVPEPGRGIDLVIPEYFCIRAIWLKVIGISVTNRYRKLYA